MKGSQNKYDKIAHSQKQQSLAKLNNPNLIESKWLY